MRRRIIGARADEAGPRGAPNAAKDVKAYVKRNKTMRLTPRRSAKRSATDHALGADQIGRRTGSVDQHRTRDELIASAPNHQRLAGASGEARLGGRAGHAGVNELRAIVTDEQDTRLPIDLRASVIVLAASLRRWRVPSERSKSGSRCSIAQRGEPAGRGHPGIGLSGRLDRGDGGGPDYVLVGTRFAAGWAGAVAGFDVASRSSVRSPSREILLAAHSRRRGDRRVAARQEIPGVSVAHATAARPPFKVVAVALADKMARMAWGLLADGHLSAPELAETA